MRTRTAATALSVMLLCAVAGCGGGSGDASAEREFRRSIARELPAVDRADYDHLADLARATCDQDELGFATEREQAAAANQTTIWRLGVEAFCPERLREGV